MRNPIKSYGKACLFISSPMRKAACANAEEWLPLPTLLLVAAFSLTNTWKSESELQFKIVFHSNLGHAEQD